MKLLFRTPKPKVKKQQPKATTSRKSKNSDLELKVSTSRRSTRWTISSGGRQQACKSSQIFPRGLVQRWI